ncbi:hypothetical protein D910_05532 [Dendroctonus ponderosae]|uniref:Uncharacterized protein n=2 Tax=Dendroctonus ponderosae TaxID=77166 RepID=U4U2N1_DENPD|nr:hypothetical protein D910_05532 [Dendroctonus ponderosae]
MNDIHISIFRDPSRIAQFKEFCHYTIDRITPKVVLATGDLTDAKTKDAIGSQQYESEWRHYRDILREFDITSKTVWLDIRGNHDNFNVISVKSKHNYFTNYSVQGREHPRSYMAQVKKGNTIYSFVGVDACLEPGPRRPFNFVGVLDEPEVIEINNLIKEIERTGSNYTIWFGHFPTSCILSSGSENVRSLIKKDPNGLVYVCGHLHTLGGLVPQMYTMQKGGYLELELGDWKDNRMYRLMAIDHGLFSFIDVRHGEWPVVLLTNPKSALFFNPLKESTESMLQSSHIRVLAFSLSRIKIVRVRISQESWTDLKHVKGPLYVTSWDAQKYRNGLQDIEVHAGLIAQPRFRGNLVKSWIRKLWILTTVDRIFWPMVLYPLYLIFGPWSIGYIVEDYIGVIFSWGIFVDGAFLPGSFTYAYGFIQMITFQIPLTVILINTVSTRYSQLSLKIGKKVSLRQAICAHLPFCIVFIIQVIMAYMFWLAYGTLAFILGPLRTWSLVLAAGVYYTALHLPDKCFRRAKELCFTKSETTTDQDAINLELQLEHSAEKVAKAN